MPSPPSTVAALRSLLAARFPERNRRSIGVVATGVLAIDRALGGGLPVGRLTELVSAAPSTGGQTVMAQLLRTTRTARQRIALIDAANGFVPDEVPSDALRHLVWVRAHNSPEAFAAADILARDGNYAVIVFDLRGLSERTLMKTPSGLWHRLRHAVESSPSAFLVQSTTPLVPAVTWRLVLNQPMPLRHRRTAKTDLANAMSVEVARGQIELEEQSA